MSTRTTNVLWSAEESASDEAHPSEENCKADERGHRHG